MSTCRKEGKDIIIFATAEDHKEPSTVTLPEPEPQAGLILPNGEINWNCPCLGGMATGPCGIEFREAFSCFHNSEADPKGSDCVDAFKEMHLCMSEYPQIYNKYNDDENDEDENAVEIDFQEADKEVAVGATPKGSSEKDSSNSKVEEKMTEKKASVHTEPKKSKVSPSTGTLNVNA